MNFNRFYAAWFDQHRQLVQQLRQAALPPTTDEHRRHLSALVQRSTSHYADYYATKSAVVRRDALAFFSEAALPEWATSLERSLHWVAGWRPSTAFHLIYTESSARFETRVVDILRGRFTGDLGDLTTMQFRRVSELQIETVREENDITDELYDWQDDVSNYVASTKSGGADLGRKMEMLAEIMGRADELRLKTIKRMVDLLTPQQSAQFLLAAAELHLGIREWGVHHDRQRAI